MEFKIQTTTSTWSGFEIMEDKTFSNALCESITNTLRHILGEACMQAVLFHLGSVQFEKTSETHSKLCSIFGSGAEVIERIAAKDLYRRLNLSYEEKSSFNFQGYVEWAKEAFEKMTRLKEAKPS